MKQMMGGLGQNLGLMGKIPGIKQAAMARNMKKMMGGAGGMPGFPGGGMPGFPGMGFPGMGFPGMGGMPGMSAPEGPSATKMKTLRPDGAQREKERKAQARTETHAKRAGGGGAPGPRGGLVPGLANGGLLLFLVLAAASPACSRNDAPSLQGRPPASPHRLAGPSPRRQGARGPQAPPGHRDHHRRSARRAGLGPGGEHRALRRRRLRAAEPWAPTQGTARLLWDDQLPVRGLRRPPGQEGARRLACPGAGREGAAPLGEGHCRDHARPRRRRRQQGLLRDPDQPAEPRLRHPVRRLQLPEGKPQRTLRPRGVERRAHQRRRHSRHDRRRLGRRPGLHRRSPRSPGPPSPRRSDVSGVRATPGA